MLFRFIFFLSRIFSTFPLFYLFFPFFLPSFLYSKLWFCVFIYLQTNFHKFHYYTFLRSIWRSLVVVGCVCASQCSQLHRAQLEHVNHFGRTERKSDFLSFGASTRNRTHMIQIGCWIQGILRSLKNLNQMKIEWRPSDGGSAKSKQAIWAVFN